MEEREDGWSAADLDPLTMGVVGWRCMYYMLIILLLKMLIPKTTSSFLSSDILTQSVSSAKSFDREPSQKTKASSTQHILLQSQIQNLIMDNGHHNNVMNFWEWRDHPTRTFADIWEVCDTRVIGLGRPFIELIDRVTEILNDIHERDIYNGNLLENLRISSITVGSSLTWKVELVNPFPNLIDPIEGIITDVQHFRFMVYSVINRFPLNVHNVPYFYPDAWLLFFQRLYDFYLPYENYTCLEYVKKIAFYNYSHPLFFDKVKMAHFIYKVYEIRKRNPHVFNRLVRLDQTTPLTNMTNWLDAIPVDPNIEDWDINQPPLRQVLYDRQGPPPYLFRNYFELPNEVITYLRTVCEHARDINRYAWSGKILKELHQVLPDALPKIHFLLCSKFNDQICLTHFSADNMVKLMRHGPFGYKGLKF